MKTIKLFVAAAIISFSAMTQAQTADEIISNYFENTGGMDKWNALEGVKFEGACTSARNGIAYDDDSN